MARSPVAPLRRKASEMASRAHNGGASTPPIAAPLGVLLAAIPSLPRPILARLTARLIDRLDEIDGDENLEDGGDAEEGPDREGPGAPGENWHAFLPDRPI